VREGEKVGERLAVVEPLGLPPPGGGREAEGGMDAVSLPEKIPVSDGVTELLGEGENAGVGERVGEREGVGVEAGDREALPLKAAKVLPEGQADEVREGAPVRVAPPPTPCWREEEGERVPGKMGGERDPVEDSEMRMDFEGVREVVVDSEGVGEWVCERERAGEREVEGE